MVDTTLPETGLKVGQFPGVERVSFRAVSAGKLFRITGHRQESTNIIYTHVLPRDLEEVRAVQEEIILSDKAGTTT